MTNSPDLKAPVRKATKTKKVETVAVPKTRQSFPFFLLLLGVLAGAGAMYFVMPMVMGPPPGMDAGGPPPGAGGPPGGMAAMAMPVEGAVVSKRSMSQSLTVTATLAANESAMIKAEVSGRIVKIPFTEGAVVKKGDILFEMDDSVQRATLAQAQASENLARSNVARYKDLVNERAIARVRYEEAQAELKNALATIALAKANMGKTTIRAPFDGTVGIRQVSVGDVVDPSRDLVSVTQTSPLRVLFDVPERFLSLVAKDAVVPFRVESYPDRVFDAVVVARDSMINPTTRAVRVQASVPNDDSTLLSGQFATLAFATSAAKDVLAIPDSALVPQGGEVVVFKIGEGDVVGKVTVTVGLRDGNYAEILTGLSDGDRVVIAGQQKIFPGMKVAVLPPSAITVEPSPEEESVR